MTPAVGPFLSKGHYLNKRGRSLLGNATYQISRLLALLFQTVSVCFPYISLYQNMCPQRQAHFWPQRDHLNKLDWLRSTR